MVIGIFDIVCTAKTRMEYPELYSQTADTFDVQTFWMWVLNAIVHSFLLFWLCLFSLEDEVVWSNGKEGGYLVLGTFIYTVIYIFIWILLKTKKDISLSLFQYVVVVVSLKAGLHIKSWSYIVHVAIWGSIAAWFVFIIIYRYATNLHYIHTIHKVLVL